MAQPHLSIFPTLKNLLTPLKAHFYEKIQGFLDMGRFTPNYDLDSQLTSILCWSLGIHVVNYDQRDETASDYYDLDPAKGLFLVSKSQKLNFAIIKGLQQVMLRVEAGIKSGEFVTQFEPMGTLKVKTSLQLTEQICELGVSEFNRSCYDNLAILELGVELHPLCVSGSQFDIIKEIFNTRCARSLHDRTILAGSFESPKEVEERYGAPFGDKVMRLLNRVNLLNIDLDEVTYG